MYNNWIRPSQITGFWSERSKTEIIENNCSQSSSRRIYRRKRSGARIKIIIINH